VSGTNSIARGSVSVICVEPWTGRSGASRRISRARPRSCTITASAPPSAMAVTKRAISGSSSEKINVLQVTYPRTLRACRKSMTLGSSSSVKFVARWRALKFERPK